jgi:hypothetical protein
MPWHDLRHTRSVLLISCDTQPTLVQYLVGRSSYTMTLNRYSRWISLMGRHTATAREEALRWLLLPKPLTTNQMLYFLVDLQAKIKSRRADSNR